MTAKRAMLLPAIGDPVLSKLWIRQFKKGVQEQIEGLYVHLNSTLPDEVMEFTFNLYKSVAKKVTVDALMVSHGKALRILYDISEEPLIMLVEDDCFIFKHEYVDRCFRGIEREEYDLAGSPRGSCAKEIWEAARERWNLSYIGEGDVGPNFWPNCLFVKRSDLAKTDLYFGEKEFRAGDYIAPLNYTMQETGYGDTLVWMSLQLRDLPGIKIKEIPQYHGSLYELSNYVKHHGIWDGQAPWTHTGSSSSLQSMLLNKELPKPTTNEERWEQERRIAWWLVAYELCEMDADLRENKKVWEYVEGCEKFIYLIIREAGLSATNVSRLVRGYRDLLQ